MTDTPPFDRLFEEGAGNGLYALAVSNWETAPDPGAFFIKNMARQALTRMAHAAAERPDEVDTVLDHLLASTAERAALAEQFPPVPGAEYVTPGVIAGWLEDFRRLVKKEVGARGITPAAWLNGLGAPWNQIGKVFFHLAENRDDATGSRPFAFMATFAHQSAADNQVRHLPLSTALKLHEGNYTALLAVLQPLKEAARESSLLQRLLDNGKIYAPLAWSAAEARDFLQDTPAYEHAGIIVRMVNLWRKSPPKLQVKVTADAPGSEKTAHSSGLSVHSLLRFSVAATLGGRDLAPEELEELLSNGDGLIRFKGEWVRVDAQKVRDLMDRWTKAARMMSSLGIPLVQGLRLLVNGPSDQLAQLPEPDEDCVVEPGRDLRQALDILAGEVSVSVPELAPRLNALMRPYQKEGFSFLYRVTERGFGACLADDMGLGKTLQVIAWLDALRREGRLEGLPALIVAPASLLSNWKEEAERFAPELALRIMHPSAPDSWQPEEIPRREGCHAVITTYGMAARAPALAGLHFPAIILDEAQAIKNAGSARSRAIRSLHGERRAALSGTPVENNLNELWSLMEFLNPGLLGGRKSFEAFTRSLERGYAPLRRLVRPFILRRMKTDRSPGPRPAGQDGNTRLLPPHAGTGRPVPDADRYAARHAGRTGPGRPPHADPARPGAPQANLQPSGAVPGHGRLRPGTLRKVPASSGIVRLHRRPAGKSHPLHAVPFHHSPSARLAFRGLRPFRAYPARRHAHSGTPGHRHRLPEGIRASLLHPVPEGRRDRTDSDPGLPRHPCGPLVEPRRGKPGDGPGLPHRPAPERAGAPPDLPRHH